MKQNPKINEKEKGKKKKETPFLSNLMQSASLPLLTSDKLTTVLRLKKVL